MLGLTRGLVLSDGSLVDKGLGAGSHVHQGPVLGARGVQPELAVTTGHLVAWRGRPF